MAAAHQKHPGAIPPDPVRPTQTLAYQFVPYRNPDQAPTHGHVHQHTTTHRGFNPLDYQRMCQLWWSACRLIANHEESKGYEAQLFLALRSDEVKARVQALSGVGDNGPNPVGYPYTTCGTSLGRASEGKA